MENQLQTQSKHLSLNTPLNEKEQEIATIVWNINLFVSFPLNDNQLEAWAKTINRLKPELKTELLNNLMDKFIEGKIEWDNHKGIQNIFRELNKYGQTIQF